MHGFNCPWEEEREMEKEGRAGNPAALPRSLVTTYPKQLPSFSSLLVWELVCPGQGRAAQVNSLSLSISFLSLIGHFEALWTFLPFDLTAFEAQVQP